MNADSVSPSGAASLCWNACDEFDAIPARVADVKGPIRVTAKVHDAASAELSKLAAERAAEFARDVPNLDGWRTVGAADLALLRLSRGDIVHDT